MQQFKGFCLVGGLGFAVDSICFILLEWQIQNTMLARIFAFWLAATTTWLGNNLITWRHKNCPLSLYQWGRYLLFCHFSGALNLLVFWICLGQIATWPGFCMGIGAGLFSHYFLLNRYVFIAQTNSAPHTDLA